MGADLPLEAIRSQIASALDVLIHLGRLRDRSRKVLWITEVDGYEKGEIRLHTLYEFQEEGEGSAGSEPEEERGRRGYAKQEKSCGRGIFKRKENFGIRKSFGQQGKLCNVPDVIGPMGVRCRITGVCQGVFMAAIVAYWVLPQHGGVCAAADPGLRISVDLSEVLEREKASLSGTAV